MILSTTSAGTNFSAPGGSPATGSDAGSTEPGFFGVLLNQATAEGAPEAAPVAPNGTQAPGEPLLSTASGPATAEPFAPVATSLLVATSWGTPASSLDVPLSALTPVHDVEASPLIVTPAVELVIVSTPASSVQGSHEAASTEAKEELGEDPEAGALIAAFVVPLPVAQPLKATGTETAATPGTVGSDTPAIAGPAQSPHGEADMLETSDATAAAADPEDGGIPASAIPPTSVRQVALRQAGGGDLFVATETDHGEVGASLKDGETRMERSLAADDDRTGMRNAPAVPQGTEQPAVVAAAAAQPRPMAALPREEMQSARVAAPSETVAAIRDAAQSGAGGLDQFSAGAGPDGILRPDATNPSKPGQVDFKSMLAASDAPAEPSRAAQIASVQIEKAAASRNTDALTIQLEPLDLGKIEVRLDFGSEGRVHASITADKVDTLDLLQRDSRSLERALQSAGLQTDAGSLNFNLRGDTRSGREFGQRGSKGSSGQTRQQDVTEIQIVAAGPALGPAGRVDIRI